MYMGIWRYAYGLYLLAPRSNKYLMAKSVPDSSAIEIRLALTASRVHHPFFKKRLVRAYKDCGKQFKTPLSHFERKIRRKG
jgi:hypothetical protein